MFKNIIKAKFRAFHFTIVTLIAALVTWYIAYMMPTFMWAAFIGDGPHSDSFYTWTDILGYVIPLIVTYPFVIIPAIINYRKGNYSATKNYIIAALVILWVEVLAFNILLT